MQQVLAKGDAKTVKKLTRLLKEAERESIYRVATRIRAVIMSINEHGSSNIAEILRVDRTRIPVWVNNWNQFGEDGLLEGYRSGRNRRLDQTMLEILYDIIESGPIAYGLNTGIWNSIIIAQLIEDEFGIKYHPGHVRKLLKEIGFSVQRPTISLINAKESTKNRWIRYTFPNLKKKSKRKTASSSTKTKRRLGKTRHSTKLGRP